MVRRALSIFQIQAWQVKGGRSYEEQMGEFLSLFCNFSLMTELSQVEIGGMTPPMENACLFPQITEKPD